MDAAKGAMNRATIGPFSDTDPRFGPDGRSVMFASTRDPFRSPHRVTLAGQPPELLRAFKGLMFALDDWSADGEWMIYHHATGGAVTPAIKAVRLDRVTDEPIPVATALTGILDQAMMSSDGRWVAFNSTESGRAEVYVVPFPPTGDKWQVSVNGGAQPIWRKDSRELYYLALDGVLMAVPIKAGNTFTAADPMPLFRSPMTSVSSNTDQYAAAPDGSRFLFAPYSGNRATASLTVLTNWQRLLNR